MVETLKVRYPAFGERVRRRATELGVTKTEIKSALSISTEMARRYWEGIAKPRDDKMDLLAALLKMPASLLDRGEYSQTVTAGHVRTSEPDLPQEAQELAYAWLRLPLQKRDLFRQLIMLDAGPKPADNTPPTCSGSEPTKDS